MPVGNAVNFELFVYTPPVGTAVNFSFGTVSHPPFFLGFGASGKIGKEGGPDLLGVNGIYQMRKTLRGKIPIKMVFYRPTNPRTTKQQDNRAKFAQAMSAWQSLTDSEKLVYIKRAKKRQMFGWGLFVREYYQSH